MFSVPWLFPIPNLLKRTPVRSFVLYPILTVLWELLWQRGTLSIRPLFLPLMLWGYLQYRLCGLYRIKHGGGGPGLETPPERLVTRGPYAYTRNPMYLGHVIFLCGLALSLQSLFAALIAVVTAAWFHSRVLADERRLVKLLGQPYVEYLSRVKRWLPGLF
ncbi:MAG: methyltransferase family protein [Candidatus Binatia bacterium]